MAQPRTLGAGPHLSRSARVDRTTRLLAELADGPEDVGAVEDELIRINMVVARDVARRYQGRGLAAEDLDQVAYLGLCKAVRRYDASKATDFLSYAVPSIRGEVRRWFRDRGWVVRPPRSIQELQAKVTATQEELARAHGRTAEPEEIASSLGVDLGVVNEALAARGCFTPTSLDGALGDHGDEGPPLCERLGDDDPGFGRAEARVTLEPLLAELSVREKRMLEMRFVQGATQAEIGAEIGVTQMQVSRLLSALLARMRDRLLEDDMSVAAA